MLAFLEFSDASEALDIYFRYWGEASIITCGGVIGVTFEGNCHE
jgi:hypothetical protein